MAALILSHLVLVGTFDLAAAPVWTVTVLMVGFVAYAVALRRFEHRLLPLHVVAVAVLLRLILAPLPPTLSDDMLRYVWDGRVVAAGFDPYALAPDAEALASLRDERWQRMPHKEVPTVYPPLALSAFALAGLTPYPFLALKVLLVLADIGSCLLLLALARDVGLVPGRAAWYAWNPLVTLEISGQGHVDGLMLPAMIAAVLLLLRARNATAGAAAAAGVLAKLVPLVALPLWARQAFDFGRWRGAARFIVAAALVLLLATLPILFGVGVPPGLVTYGVSWEFNGPLYEPLWRAIDHAGLVRVIKAGIDRLKAASDHDPRWNSVYPFVYPQLLAKLVLAAGFGLFFLVELLRRRQPVAAAGRLFGAVLLASATVYPWYLLWVLPWAALGGRRSWLVLSALLPVSYLPQHVVGVGLFPIVWSVVWIPFFALLVLDPRWPMMGEPAR